MKRVYGLVCAACVTVASNATAQDFERHLLPPELIMQHQRSIDLKPPQRESITTAIRALQASVVELEWDMQAEGQELSELLSGTTVDEAAALAQVDRVLNIERRIKKAHLGLLIQIKNTLTAEQQATLRELRARADRPDGRPDDRP